MSEEQVLTADAGIDSGDSGANYAADAWDANYFSSHEAELKPDAAQDPKAQTPKDSNEKPQAETPKPTEQNAKQVPDKQEPQKSRFEQAFAGENGEIDVDKFLGFSLPESPVSNIAPVDLNVQTAPVIKQEQWQADQEEIKTLSATLTSELLDPLQRVADLIAQGTDPRQALEKEYAERKAFIDSHVADIQGKKEFARQQALETRLLEKQRTEAIEKQCATNVNEIISALPGNTPQEKAELYNEVLFGSDTGAKVLDFYFKQAVPGNEKLPPEDRKMAAVKFINGIMSDKGDLRFVFNQALNA